MYRRIAKTTVLISLAVTLVLCTAVSASAKNIQGRKQISFNSTWSIFWNDYGSQIVGVAPILQTDGSYRIDTSSVAPVDFPQYRLTISGSFDTSSMVGSTVDLSFEVADVFDTWIPLYSYVGNDTYMNVGSSSCYPDKLYTDDGTEGFHFIIKNYKVENSSTSFYLNLWLKSPKVEDQIFNIYILQNAFVSASDITIEDSTNEIKNNQDKNTDKIIENDKAMQEQEKQEISSSGNDSVDSITSIIPDVGTEGIKNSIESLLNGMSYNGTDCVWTFPALKIPAIGGVIPEMKLTDEQPIDLGYWVRQLPESVLKTIQALCSIAIVLFVLYSLFDFVIYCFSLKSNGSGKGDDDE